MWTLGTFWELFFFVFPLIFSGYEYGIARAPYMFFTRHLNVQQILKSCPIRSIFSFYLKTLIFSTVDSLIPNTNL
ncbi:hypothetical protein Hanom_Chr07g00600651 [Helianthus anomalus]